MNNHATATDRADRSDPVGWSGQSMALDPLPHGCCRFPPGRPGRPGRPRRGSL